MKGEEQGKQFHFDSLFRAGGGRELFEGFYGLISGSFGKYLWMGVMVCVHGMLWWVVLSSPFSRSALS